MTENTNANLTTTEATTKVTNGYVNQSTMSTDAITASMGGLNTLVTTIFDGLFGLAKYAASEDEKRTAAREAAEEKRLRQQYEAEAERQERQQEHEERMQQMKNDELDKQIKLEELKTKNRKSDKI